MAQFAYRFEVSEYANHGRISFGRFGEFPDAMKPTDMELLSIWWKSFARRASRDLVLWTAVRSLRVGSDHPTPRGVCDGIVIAEWTQKMLLATVEHQMRAVSGSSISDDLVRRMWSTDSFGLFDANDKSLDTRALERLQQDVLPSGSFLQGVRAAIIPWYHRQWLDLYCSRLDVEEYVGDLRESAAELGLQIEQGKDEFV